MPMKMLIILETAGIMAAYLSVTVAAPWILLRKKFGTLRMSERLMACFLCGNFYVMNLVFLLQLLHISHRSTLIIGTLVPFLASAFVKHRKSISISLEQGTRRIRVVTEGEMGIKTWLYNMGRRLQRLSSGLLGEWMAPRWPDILLTLGIVGTVLYVYGTTAVNVYGYMDSNIVAHNYWVNELGNNNLFAAGIYPFGFHVVVYYLHEIFSIPVYVLLRLFCIVQVLMIHLMLLFFLKAVCRSRYAPYIGTFLFTAADLFGLNAYSRYYSSLPQEFGRAFILPSVYFAIAFLRKRKVDSEDSGDSDHLILFAAGVSMTLAIHFNDAIIAALFCAALAVGFGFRCFRWQYLKRILLAGTVGILVAAVPMGAAYMAGTPLGESLYWEMSESSSDAYAEEDAEEEDAVKVISESVEGSGISLAGILRDIQDKIRIYVAKGDDAAAWCMLGSAAMLLCLGIVWCILKRREYGGILISVSVFVLLLFLLQASAGTGLPELIEIPRYAIYIAYGLGAVWGLGADALLLLLFREKKAVHGGSLAVLMLVCVAVAANGIRPPIALAGQEPNAAVVCLANIIRENRGDGTWTICSSSDESQMTHGYGNHYELIDFLREMENADSGASVTIPTKTVYFFVEKIPIRTDGNNTGRTVSPEGAGKTLPTGPKSSVYQQDSRWVVMSRFYYWAQEFKRLYPNEMEVYYETDDFVCYRIRQNEYSLYNFAIDYGYN